MEPGYPLLDNPGDEHLLAAGKRSAWALLAWGAGMGLVMTLAVYWSLSGNEAEPLQAQDSGAAQAGAAMAAPTPGTSPATAAPLASGQSGIEDVSPGLALRDVERALIEHVVPVHFDLWRPGTLYLGRDRGGQVQDLGPNEQAAFQALLQQHGGPTIRVAPQSRALPSPQGVRDRAILEPTGAPIATAEAEPALNNTLLILGCEPILASTNEVRLQATVYRGPRPAPAWYTLRRPDPGAPWAVTGVHDPAGRASSWANLLVSACIALTTLLILVLGRGCLRRTKTGMVLGRDFRLRSLRLWAGAWFLLVLAWSVAVSSAGLLERSVASQALTAFLHNGHSAGLLLAGLAVTRGSGLSSAQTWRMAARVASTLGLLAALCYGLSWLFTDSALAGLRVHQTWSQGLAAVSALAFGWALLLRFNTTLLLAIGIVYAVLSPLAAPAIATSSPQDPGLSLLSDMRPLAALSLAVLHALWASAVLVTICSRDVGTDEDLVAPLSGARPRRRKRKVEAEVLRRAHIQSESPAGSTTQRWLLPFWLLQRSSAGVIASVASLLGAGLLSLLIFSQAGTRSLLETVLAIGLTLAAIGALESGWRAIGAFRARQANFGFPEPPPR